MDHKIENNAPSEEELSDLFSQIQFHPGQRFSKKMAATPWNQRRHSPIRIVSTPIRAAAVLSILFLFVFGLSFFSPSLNTLAQHITLFFSPSPTRQPVSSIAPLVTSHPLERFNLTITETESLAGFKMHTPSSIPDGFYLIGATYDELREAIILHFTTDSGGLVLRISQQRNDTEYQGIGPEAVVEMVSIGKYNGEYVAGGWMIPEVESEAKVPSTPSAPYAVWDAKVNLQTLRWSDGKFLYEIILAGGYEQPNYLTKDGLITLANNMQ